MYHNNIPTSDGLRYLRVCLDTPCGRDNQVGVVSAWEQEKNQSQKMPHAAESGSPACLRACYVRFRRRFPQRLLLFLWHVLLQDTEAPQQLHLTDTVYR